MKKILLLAGLLTCLVMAVLTMSSCGFSASGGLEIEKISAEWLDDGSGATRITIKYFDDVEEPLVFDIPMGLPGEQGEPGETGNGIKRIDITNSEDGNTKTMEIFYTDPEMEPTRVEVQNGVSILSAEREDVKETKLNENGEEIEVTVAYMVLTLSNGDTQRVKLPEGVQGPGISKLHQDIDPNTHETVVVFELENGKRLTPIRIQPGARGKSIERVVTEDWVENGNKLGVTLHFYVEDSDLPLASVNLREGVGIGELKTTPIMVEGKQVGTKFYFEKTDGTVTEEIEVKDGVGVVDIVSKAQADGSTKVTIYLSNNTSTEFIIPAAVSIRDISTDVLANGDTVITIHKTVGDPTTFTVKKAVGITDVQIVQHPEDVTQYIMQITYSDGNVQEVPFDKPTAWHHGNGAPTVALTVALGAHPGDYYFDHDGTSIWYYESKEEGWQLVADLDATDDPATLTFHIDPTLGESWSRSTSTYSFTKLHKGQVFAGSGYSLIVPKKTPTVEEQENGITGYRFLGWCTSREPNGTNGFFTDLTVISGDIDLFPVWEAIQ